MTIQIIIQTGRWVAKMFKAMLASYVEAHRRHADTFPQFPMEG